MHCLQTDHSEKVVSFSFCVHVICVCILVFVFTQRLVAMYFLSKFIVVAVHIFRSSVSNMLVSGYFNIVFLYHYLF